MQPADKICKGSGRMKVLHLLYSNSFSGAENVVCQIMGMLKDHADAEMVYCSPNGSVCEALAERNIRFAPLKEFSAAEIRRVILEENPDIIHAHDMRASFYAARVCGKIPLISHVHNNDSRGISPKSIAYLYAAKKARHIFWVSQSSFDGYAFRFFFKKKSTVLYNIIDIRALYEKMSLDLQEYDYEIAYVGRLTFQKNPQRLLNVFRLVHKKLPHVRFAVVGTGSLEEELKTLAKEYGLLDHVAFLGFQSNPLKILHDSKVMVMTSRYEGTPMCALEAMALGVPIVSTPVDGLKDLVINGKNGYLSDDDDELADKICEIVEDDKLHRQYSDFIQTQAKEINNIEKYKTEILKRYRDCHV